ncbi:hypothetical protein JTB14_018524 [Gonioctena quinquepunctata]|nr:hypothetical protein JTB14_018524 [Gonioctena quinquepunctata]
MKVVAVVLVLVAVAAAAPQVMVVPTGDSKDSVIVRYGSDNTGLGQYGYNVETSDGQKKEESGQLVNAGTKEEHIAAVQEKYRLAGQTG